MHLQCVNYFIGPTYQHTTAFIQLYLHYFQEEDHSVVPQAGRGEGEAGREEGGRERGREEGGREGGKKGRRKGGVGACMASDGTRLLHQYLLAVWMEFTNMVSPTFVNTRI